MLLEPTQTNSPLPRFAHVRKHNAIETVGPHAVDIILGHELLRGESLTWPKAHVAGIMDQNVNLAGFFHDFVDSSSERLFTDNVQGHRAHIDLFLLDEGFDVFDGRIAGGRVAHANVYNVPCFGEGFSRHVSKPARGTSNDDDLRL